MIVQTPEQLADWRPYQKHAFFFVPFLPDGFKKVGENEDGTDIALYLSFNVKLYPTFGRVLAVHPTCSNVEVGDVVWYRPNCYEWVTLNDGREFGVMNDLATGRGALWGVIEDYDSPGFFLPEMQAKPEILLA